MSTVRTRIRIKDLHKDSPLGAGVDEEGTHFFFEILEDAKQLSDKGRGDFEIGDDVVIGGKITGTLQLLREGFFASPTTHIDVEVNEYFLIKKPKEGWKHDA